MSFCPSVFSPGGITWIGGGGECPDWEKLSQVDEGLRGCGIVWNGPSGVCRDSGSLWAKGNSEIHKPKPALMIQEDVVLQLFSVPCAFLPKLTPPVYWLLRLSLNRGDGLWHYMSYSYNAILSCLPRQLNSHSCWGSPSHRNPYEGRWSQRPTSCPNDSETANMCP